VDQGIGVGGSDPSVGAGLELGWVLVTLGDYSLGLWSKLRVTGVFLITSDHSGLFHGFNGLIVLYSS
jgi:hypothetical protein